MCMIQKCKLDVEFFEKRLKNNLMPKLFNVKVVNSSLHNSKSYKDGLT